MLVVSDSSPLNILIRAELIHILPQLFPRVLIPTAVADELNQDQTPTVVRDWLRAAPKWFEIRAPSMTVSAERKGRGERQAIRLAVELHADLVLADDRTARRQAMSAGLQITGTLGVLEQAARHDLVELDLAIERVLAAGLFLSPGIVANSLRREAERKTREP